MDGREVLEMTNSGLPQPGGERDEWGREGSPCCPPRPSLRKAAPVEDTKADGPLGPVSGVAVLRKGRQLPGVPGCGSAPPGRAGEASAPQVEREPFLAADPKRSRKNPKFLPPEVGVRGVLPLKQGLGNLPGWGPKGWGARFLWIRPLGVRLRQCALQEDTEDQLLPTPHRRGHGGRAGGGEAEGGGGGGGGGGSGEGSRGPEASGHGPGLRQSRLPRWRGVSQALADDGRPAFSPAANGSETGLMDNQNAQSPSPLLSGVSGREDFPERGGSARRSGRGGCACARLRACPGARARRRPPPSFPIVLESGWMRELLPGPRLA